MEKLKIRKRRNDAFISAFCVVFFVALSHLGFFLRDYLMIYKFGFTRELDAFNLALLLPMFFVGIFSIPFGQASISFLHKISNSNLDIVKQTINSLFTSIFVIMFFLSLVLYIFSDVLYYFLSSTLTINPKFSSNLANKISIILLFLSGPLILSNSISSLNNRLVFPSIAQLIVPFSSISFLFLFGGAYHVLSVIFGMIFGQFLNLCIVYYFNSKEDLIFDRILVRNDILLKNKFWGSYASLISISVFSSIIILVNTLYASSLGPGSLSIYSLASKLTLAIITLLTSVFNMVLLPYFSGIANNFHKDFMDREISLFLFLGTLISIPISIFLFIFSDLFVFYLFDNIGESKVNLQQISGVMKYSFLQLPFWVFNMTILRHANAIRRIKFVVIISCLSFVVNAILSFNLIKYMSLSGLSLSVSVSVGISSLLMLIFYTCHNTLKVKNALTIALAWIFFMLLIVIIKVNNLSF